MAVAVEEINLGACVCLLVEDEDEDGDAGVCRFGLPYSVPHLLFVFLWLDWAHTFSFFILIFQQVYVKAPAIRAHFKAQQKR